MFIKSLLNTKILSVLMLVTALAACSSDDDKAGANGANGTDLNGGTAGVGSVTPGTQADLVANIGDRIFFELNSDQVSSEGQATLRRQAEWLSQHSSVNITIEGHADERGTREFNLALGERRANAAKAFLTSLGVSSSRINTVSYGKEHPGYVGSDEAAWSKNRRAVTVVN